MKSFKIHPSPPVVATTPDQLAADLQPEERSRLSSAFGLVAGRHRRITSISGWVFTGAVVTGMTAFVVPQSVFVWSGIGMVAGMVAAWAILVFRPRLVCPCCANQLNDRLGPFCPECGARALQPAGWLLPRKCTECRRRMWRGKSRIFRIRACTACGLWLDDKGL